MTKIKETQEKEETQKKQEQEDWPLPYCTTSADPEHQRAYQEDEPCNDARGSVIQEQTENEQDEKD